MTSTPLILSLALTLSTGIAFAANPDWPKGIDPATLLTNSDPEPDLNAPGFIEIFNGKDLSGWSVQGSPMKFAAKDGAIVGTCIQDMRPNSFLCTDKTYSDFIFTAKFKWDVLGNSGIMFRAATQAPDDQGIRRVFGYQSEMDQNERRWTGGIYGEAMGGWKYPLSQPEGHAAARGAIQDHMAWNRMTISAQGDVIQTWINGVPCSHLVNDERSEGFFGLQVHSGQEGTIHWRDIRVKDLAEPVASTDLFADGTFSQWQRPDGKDVPDGWQIEDGVVHRTARAGDIITRTPYEDFELSFAWKISEGGNSGVKYRVRNKLGLEYQVLDDAKHKDGNKPSHRSASLYDLLAAPDEKPLKPAGEWNTGKIVARGPQLEHWLNGERVMQIDQSTEQWQQRFQESKYGSHDGFGLGSGSILLQDHGDEVWYRNLQIRDLTVEQ